MDMYNILDTTEIYSYRNSQLQFSSLFYFTEKFLQVARKENYFPSIEFNEFSLFKNYHLTFYFIFSIPFIECNKTTLA